MNDGTVRMLMYDAKPFDKVSFERVRGMMDDEEERSLRRIEIDYVSVHLNELSAHEAKGYTVVCVFVNCLVNSRVVEILSRVGVRMIALRCSGFQNVDIHHATLFNIKVVRVPVYSPHSIAEYAVSLLLCLVRSIPRSYERTRAQNFSIDGFVGFDLFAKTVAVIGTGRIGMCTIKILKGMGCKVVAFDVNEDQEAAKQLQFTYHSLENTLKLAHVIFLFAPLTQQTHHLINRTSIGRMQDAVVLVNCARGALVDSNALIDALNVKKVAAAALDVYENEKDYFFKNLRNQPIHDERLAKLVRMNNVILTSHQAYLTEEALDDIAKVTLKNIVDFCFRGLDTQNDVTTTNLLN